jgi:muramoyltetrapeptide carboxypeptidase LdcA involved in peptidoglycan recycling
MLQKQLSANDKVGIVCCSDGRHPSNKAVIDRTIQIINDLGFVPVVSPYIYRVRGLESAPPKKRAAVLMDFYKDDTIKAIFDIGGGDLANQILEYLDFQVIEQTDKQFWGYSDLTTVINSIYTKTGKSSWLYQVRKLAEADVPENIAYFSSLLNGYAEGTVCGLPRSAIHFLQGQHMEGTLVGGNIRVLLKLAGTEYFPDLTGKILFLESLEGGIGLVATWLTQLRMLGAFCKINGLVLGTYTELDKDEGADMVEMLAREIIDDPTLPVARTMKVGHDIGSYALHIGEYFNLT